MRKYKCEKSFFIKTGTFDVYKWCVQPTNYNKLSNQRRETKLKKPIYFCTAISGSQGVDFTNTYVYNNIVINGEPSRLAYVECDYVS